MDDVQWQKPISNIKMAFIVATIDMADVQYSILIPDIQYTISNIQYQDGIIPMTWTMSNGQTKKVQDSAEVSGLTLNSRISWSIIIIIIIVVIIIIINIIVVIIITIINDTKPL